MKLRIELETDGDIYRARLLDADDAGMVRGECDVDTPRQLMFVCADWIARECAHDDLVRRYGI
jgi:hypothetical protein